MNIQSFRGTDIRQVTMMAEQALGDDAMIVTTRVLRTAPPQVEVVAAPATEIERLRRRIEPTPILRPSTERRRPMIVSVVGPTGAGKTTTLAKLAVNPGAFGGWKVGLLTIDTYRTGALEQLESYAQVTGMPLEVVYSPEDVEGAIGRLDDCDVILVDTPGRSPRNPEHNRAWMELIEEIGPDEVHLVIPATMRLDAAMITAEAYEEIGVTHLLLTKLDEVMNDAGVADAAIEMRYPSRWVTDGQEIPTDLHAAVPRILGALGGYTGGTNVYAKSA